MERADVIVAGAGLVGLACALALAERGLRVLLTGHGAVTLGEASIAAGGILGPSVERSTSQAHEFAVAARDRYPGYLQTLEEQTGRRVPLNRAGILEVALDDRSAAELRSAGRGSQSRWLDGSDLFQLEPALAHASGGWHHPEDGAVDNVALIATLRARLKQHERIRATSALVTEVRPGSPAYARTNAGDEVAAEAIVLAAGAWTAGIRGLPRALPIEPVRGQMLLFDGSPARHVTYGARGYLVPRGAGIIAGSTMEHVGFVAETTPEGIAAIRSAARKLCPLLAGREVVRTWCGLRPVTPDLLPIIGRDPDHPSIIYACGHSRNGILLAPLTADCVAAIADDDAPAHDLVPFAVTRFGSSVAARHAR